MSVLYSKHARRHVTEYMYMSGLFLITEIPISPMSVVGTSPSGCAVRYVEIETGYGVRYNMPEITGANAEEAQDRNEAQRNERTWKCFAARAIARAMNSTEMIYS